VNSGPHGGAGNRKHSTGGGEVKMPDTIPEKIKKPILVPVAIAILVFLTSSLILISWLQKRHVRDGVKAYLQSTRVLYEGTLREETKLIQAFLNFYSQDQQLSSLFASRDREGLLAYTTPLFTEIKNKYGITHFYFIEPDQNCFLRVHNPGFFGDKIDRFTMNQAVKTGEPHSGVDLGPSGTLALRVNFPWVVDGQLLGYIELGKEVDSFMPNLSSILGVEVVMLVETRFLERERWEEGQRLMGHQRGWNEVPGYAVVGRTIRGLPKNLERFQAVGREEDGEALFTVTHGTRHYRAGVTPLFTADGQAVGVIIAMKDFSAAEHSMQMLTGLLISLVVIMSGFLFVFVYGVISRVELRLRRSRQALGHEINERRKAEKQILAALNEKQVLLKEIHHRVKNNMQIVCSIFRLQLSQIKDPRAATILRDSQSRISAMALIHKTLYQPKDQSSIYFEEYIQELASSIFDSYRVDPDRIGLKTDLESVAMDIDTVTPCGLILNELVTNSIKYAFPDERQGEIAISFRRDGDGFVLAVSDNGVGLPANFDIHLANTLGMQLVVNLSEKQLGGRLEVESGSQGTTFRIYFRESPGKSKV
jgi:two-component sensor histidine kinase